MSSEWHSTTIGDICSKVFSGGTPTSTNSTYYDGGTIPWLRTKEVNYGKIYDTEEHITVLGFENSSTKLVPVNSVIVAMYGNGDTAGRVAVNKVPVTTNQACCNLVVDTSKADYRFVYYFLMGQYKALVDLKNGGAQQNLNGQLIKAFPIACPQLPSKSKYRPSWSHLTTASPSCAKPTPPSKPLPKPCSSPGSWTSTPSTPRCKAAPPKA